MTQEEFNVVFELQMRKCADILAHKKKEYTGDNIDRLSAFKIAAALQNCDPKAALAGMMSKHVVSLYDMCYSTLLHFDMEQWDEKITDCINYLILLKALVKEEQAYGSHLNSYLKLLWNPGSRTKYGLCCQAHTTRSYDSEHGRSDGPLPSILQSEDRRKHCGASTSNRTEIHGHYRGCCWCKQTLPGTDHKTSE